MTLKEAEQRPQTLLNHLLSLWESSVRATHHFLSEKDIVLLRPMVLEAVKKVPVLLLAMEQETPVAFLGMDGDSVEMLFVHAVFRGKGAGGALLREALKRGAKRVDVNEQNPQALSFYLHMGFAVSGRDETDGVGLPFPLLHLHLVEGTSPFLQGPDKNI